MKKVEGLLVELRARHDPLAPHVSVARRQFSAVVEADSKSGKRSEREGRCSWQAACELGYRGSLSE